MEPIISTNTRSSSLITDDEIASIIDAYYKQKHQENMPTPGEVNTLKLLSSMSKDSPWTRGKQSMVH